jgi:hypothetical protein
MSKEAKDAKDDKTKDDKTTEIERYNGKWATSWWSYWLKGWSYGTCMADIPTKVVENSVINLTFTHQGSYRRGDVVILKLRVEKVYQGPLMGPTEFALTVVSNNPNFSLHNVICQQVHGSLHYSGNYTTKTPPDDGTFSLCKHLCHVNL